MRIGIDGIQPVRIESRGAPDQSVDFIAFAKQKFGQIRAVLPRDAGYQSFLGQIYTPCLESTAYAPEASFYSINPEYSISVQNFRPKNPTRIQLPGNVDYGCFASARSGRETSLSPQLSALKMTG